MKNKFTADGPARLFRARQAKKEKAIQNKYAAELAVAGPVKKLKLHAKILAETLTNSKHTGQQEPSAGALW